MDDWGAGDNLFWDYWGKRDYLSALTVYYDADRPFWLSDEVASYYEELGLESLAIKQWEHLINAYFAIRKDFLPLPNGPPELFKVARWYADKDTAKTKRYLRIYLSARDRRGQDPSFFLEYEGQAKALLNMLDR